MVARTQWNWIIQKPKENKEETNCLSVSVKRKEFIDIIHFIHNNKTFFWFDAKFWNTSVFYFIFSFARFLFFFNFTQEAWHFSSSVISGLIRNLFENNEWWSYGIYYSIANQIINNNKQMNSKCFFHFSTKSSKCARLVVEERHWWRLWKRLLTLYILLIVSCSEDLRESKKKNYCEIASEWRTICFSFFLETKEATHAHTHSKIHVYNYRNQNKFFCVY